MHGRQRMRRRYRHPDLIRHRAVGNAGLQSAARQLRHDQVFRAAGEVDERAAGAGQRCRLIDRERDERRGPAGWRRQARWGGDRVTVARGEDDDRRRGISDKLHLRFTMVSVLTSYWTPTACADPHCNGKTGKCNATRPVGQASAPRKRSAARQTFPAPAVRSASVSVSVAVVLRRMVAPTSRARRTRSWLFSVIAILATAAQLVVALVPLAEGRVARTLSAHVEAGGTRIHVAHNEATCASCQARSIHGTTSRPCRRCPRPRSPSSWRSPRSTASPRPAFTLKPIRAHLPR